MVIRFDVECDNSTNMIQVIGKGIHKLIGVSTLDNQGGSVGSTTPSVSTSSEITARQILSLIKELSEIEKKELQDYLGITSLNDSLDGVANTLSTI